MNRIKQLREEYRMTQVRLSTELGVSQETISAYEISKHYPSAKQLMKLAELFSASIDYILGLSDVRNPVNLKDLASEEIEHLHQFRKLTSIQKKQINAYMQALLDNRG